MISGLMLYYLGVASLVYGFGIVKLRMDHVEDLSKKEDYSTNHRGNMILTTRLKAP